MPSGKSSQESLWQEASQQSVAQEAPPASIADDPNAPHPEIIVPPPAGKNHRGLVTGVLNLLVLVASVILIVWISLDTFKKIDFLNSHPYMTFQLWVCVFFVTDFFVGLYYADDRWRFFRHRFVFLLLSIPYLNIINQLDITLSPDGTRRARTCYRDRLSVIERRHEPVHVIPCYNAARSLFLFTYILPARTRG